MGLAWIDEGSNMDVRTQAKPDEQHGEEGGEAIHVEWKCIDGLRGTRWRTSVRNICGWKDKEKFGVERNNWFWRNSKIKSAEHGKKQLREEIRIKTYTRIESEDEKHICKQRCCKKRHSRRGDQWRRLP